ncbi:MAG: L-malate glycosyltransferase, partial [Patescibacteria group bacterium]|nr:L-malate glycosyltransferase [Patescibacteria group bacterium]
YIDVPKMMESRNEKLIEGDYILYVGRFEPEKNVESIIRGFAQASSSLPDLKLVLLGSGALLPSYKVLAKDLGVSDRMIHIPWSNDVGSYMKHSKALVLASWFEGFALVLVEAILNDCPIITTDVGAIGGIIPRDYAHIFNQNDTEGLSEKIKEVVLNSEVSKEKVKEVKTLVLSKIPKDLDSYAKIFKESLERTLI